MKLYCKKTGKVIIMMDENCYFGTNISSYKPYIEDYRHLVTIGKLYNCEQVYSDSAKLLLCDDNGDMSIMPMALFTENKDKIDYDFDIKKEYEKVKSNCEKDKLDTEEMYYRKYKKKSILKKIIDWL